MRIIFMGSPDFAVEFLKQLYAEKHNIVAVFSAPLTIRSKRGNKAEHCPVGKFALEHDLALFTPKSLKPPEIQEQIENLEPDLIIVVAYGAILPKNILAIPKYGCLNVHGSILPRWRGAAPIERAIEAGDFETGVAIMQMEAGLDTGPVALTKTMEIGCYNSLELRQELAKIGAPLLSEALEKLAQGSLQFVPQIGEASYAHKISKEETKINWTQDAAYIERKIRALAPRPGAWCEMKLNADIYRVKIIKASLRAEPGVFTKQCGDGNYLKIEICQKEGGKILEHKQFIAGYNNIEIL